MTPTPKLWMSPQRVTLEGLPIIVYRNNYSSFLNDFVKARVAKTFIELCLSPDAQLRNLIDVCSPTHPLFDPEFSHAFYRHSNEQMYFPSCPEDPSFFEFYFQQDPHYLRRRIHRAQLLEQRVSQEILSAEQQIAHKDYSKIDLEGLFSARTDYAAVLLDSLLQEPPHREPVHIKYLREIFPSLSSLDLVKLCNDLFIPSSGRGYLDEIQYGLLQIAAQPFPSEEDYAQFITQYGVYSLSDLAKGSLEDPQEVAQQAKNLQKREGSLAISFRFAQTPLSWQNARLARQSAKIQIKTVAQSSPHAQFICDYIDLLSLAADYDDLNARYRKRALRVFRDVMHYYRLDPLQTTYSNLLEVHHVTRAA